MPEPHWRQSQPYSLSSREFYLSHSGKQKSKEFGISLILREKFGKKWMSHDEIQDDNPGEIRKVANKNEIIPETA